MRNKCPELLNTISKRRKTVHGRDIKKKNDPDEIGLTHIIENEQSIIKGIN